MKHRTCLTLDNCPHLRFIPSCSTCQTTHSMPIQIEGLADLSNMLAEMSPRAAKRWLLRAAEPAARVVLDAMHETVPVDVGVLEEAGTWEKEWETGDEAV